MTVHTARIARACSDRECTDRPRYISSDRMRYYHRDDIVISFPTVNRRLAIVEVLLDVTSSWWIVDRSNGRSITNRRLLIFRQRSCTLGRLFLSNDSNYSDYFYLIRRFWLFFYCRAADVGEDLKKFLQEIRNLDWIWLVIRGHIHHLNDHFLELWTRIEFKMSQTIKMRSSDHSWFNDGIYDNNRCWSWFILNSC